MCILLHIIYRYIQRWEVLCNFFVNTGFLYVFNTIVLMNIYGSV